MGAEKMAVNEFSGKITMDEFVQKVKAMRFQQRRYFKFRKPETLEVCKQLEQEVDEIVAALTDTQMRLF